MTAATPRSMRPGPRPGARALRVLIADDDRDTVMTLGILLRSESFNVRLATCGAEVLALVQEFRPDVVLLDIAMPDRSGLQVALDLKRELGERCPVLVAVTAHSTDAARRLTAKSGFQHHVAKPYDPEALIRLMASIEPAD
jgi:CheY-like chemotaxis protein